MLILKVDAVRMGYYIKICSVADRFKFKKILFYCLTYSHKFGIRYLEHEKKWLSPSGYILLLELSTDFKIQSFSGPHSVERMPTNFGMATIKNIDNMLWNLRPQSA